MSSYSELIKSFEHIRAYIRDFYIYGYKSRGDYTGKSSRSYDDERRRIESWLGKHIGYIRSSEGKSVYISIDSRTVVHNPFYRTWEAKSFTDGDITLHFILFDILHDPSISLSLSELMRIIDDEYLSHFSDSMIFDESTVRKKLAEYRALGLLDTHKQGKRVLYSRRDDVEAKLDIHALNFFSEVAPCGVIGSFLLKKYDKSESFFDFKHHYITSAIDSEVLTDIFSAMSEKRFVTLINRGKGKNEPRTLHLLPLRVFIGVQNGRQHLLAYTPELNEIKTYRIDNLSSVKLGDISPEFDKWRAELDRMQPKMWGVNINKDRLGNDITSHVEFDVCIEDDEKYIINRLKREMRTGKLEQIGKREYRFSADVYDATEMIPWIRTFICRITRLEFSDKTVEARFMRDLERMYELYGLTEGES